MLASLALSAALLATPQVHNFNTAYLQTHPDFVEATIQVDPAPVPEAQFGWLGVGDNHALTDLLQCGWAIHGGFGPVPVEYCQMWQNGVYSTVVLGSVAVGSDVTVGLTTDGRGQWLLWVKKPNGSWTIPWMGMSTLTPGNSTYMVSTEAYAPASAPVLNYRLGG